MTEFEIYSLQASNFINNAMFQVCVVISVFIAFRLARVTNEMGAGIAMKGLATLFGLGVVYFNLDMGAWRVDIFQGTAARLAELRDSGVEITQGSANWLAQSGISATDFPTHNLFADVGNVIFSLIILAIILLGIWGPKIKSSSE